MQTALKTQEVPTQQISQVGVTASFAIQWKVNANVRTFWERVGCKTNETTPERLYKDDFMALFLDEKERDRADAVLLPKMQPAVAVRHKYFLKLLSENINGREAQDKTVQVVLLGSGYDTTPVRKAKYKVSFFEIDQPEILQHKAEVYQANDCNKNAVYIPLNYVTNNFIAELRRNGLNTTRATHFIWEGNTMYLTKADVEKVIATITSNFSGKFLLSFDYILQRNNVEVGDMVKKFTAQNAPMVNLYNIDDMRTLAQKFNLQIHEDVCCADVTKKFNIDEKPDETQNGYFFCTFTNANCRAESVKIPGP